MGDGGPRAEENVAGLSSYLSMARLLAGWAGLAIGGLNLTMGFAGGPYVIFHVMLLLAGVALLSAGLLGKRPGSVAWLAGGAATLLGLLISAVPRTSAAFCCLSGYDKRHGYPFTLLAEQSGRWHLDAGRAAADLLFWACAGMFVLLAVVAASPARQPAAAPPPAEKPAEKPAGKAAEKSGTSTPRHAEPRPETVDDENVRGLP